MFDKNQDGTVLVSDLRQILSHLGEVIPEDEIDALFRRLGYTDVIRYEEFAKVLLMSDDCVVCWYCFFLILSHRNVEFKWSVFAPLHSKRVSSKVSAIDLLQCSNSSAG